MKNHENKVNRDRQDKQDNKNRFTMKNMKKLKVKNNVAVRCSELHTLHGETYLFFSCLSCVLW